MPALVSILAVAAAFASASGTPGSADFRYTGAAEVRALPADGVPAVGQAVEALPLIPAPAKLVDLRLLAQAGRKSLFSTTETPEKHALFLSIWTPFLQKAGFVPGKAGFEHGLTVLPYESADGRVVREFLADSWQFKPKDEADRLANYNQIAEGARQAGLPLLASYMVESEYLLPTYALYYVTAGAEKDSSEVQVRILKKEGADAAVLEAAGVRVLQTVKLPETGETLLVVYVGREIGMVYRTADKLEDLQARIEEFKKFIAGQGGAFIASKVMELPPGSYRKFVADLYFWMPPL